MRGPAGHAYGRGGHAQCWQADLSDERMRRRRWGKVIRLVCWRGRDGGESGDGGRVDRPRRGRGPGEF